MSQFQNATAIIVTRNKKYGCFASIFAFPYWISIMFRINFKLFSTCLKHWKIWLLAPAYLTNLINLYCIAQNAFAVVLVVCGMLVYSRVRFVFINFNNCGKLKWILLDSHVKLISLHVFLFCWPSFCCPWVIYFKETCIWK